MEKKKSSGGALERFFAGKGFYIVLFLCAAIIGISTWVLVRGSGNETDVDYAGDYLTDTAELPLIQAEEPEVAADAESEAESETETVISEDGETETAEVWAEEPEVVQTSYYIMPVVGEIENGYSATELVYNRTMSDWRTHEGIDIACEIGTAVMAAGGGTVENIFVDDLYGTTVVIDHYGGLKSLYCNLAETPTVYVGDTVSVGEIIGSVGDTALCETNEVAHLHFAMSLDGAGVDPADYLPIG
jgi:murein DD-endopeptidase MepM/ murein hydrolase activator NlpD